MMLAFILLGALAIVGGVITIAVAIIARQRFHELRDLKTLTRQQ